MSDSDRVRLRRTFDDAAGIYQEARPEYPDELFEDLLAMTGARPPASLLEIGCGPGKATLPLAKRCFHITALELGGNLAAAARRNLAGFRGVRVLHVAFEDWTPQPPPSFDLVYAATAWGWLDPETKFAKAASLLSPGGHLAAWGAVHAFPPGFDAFFTEIQAVYDEINESHPGGWPPPPPDELPDESRAFEQSGLFDVVGVRRYVWAIDYSADTYIRLLDTFSGHLSMEQDKREHLYGEMRARIAARPSGTVHRHWVAILTVGRLKEGT